MTYRLGLMSEIPVFERQGRLFAMDLWVKDLQAQANAVRTVTLFCPISHLRDAQSDLLPLPDALKVVDSSADVATLKAAIAQLDVVQIPGNFTWRASARARAFMHMASRAAKPVVLAISSDRATTMVVNSRGQGPARRIRALIGAWSIRASQRYLAKRCDGALVVGEGLRRIVEPASRNVHVGTASWIHASDICPAQTERRDSSAVRLCIAARLEKMKGIAIGLDTFKALQATSGLAPVALLIAGAGPEEAALKAQAHASGIGDRVTFAGTFGYPAPFFDLLRTQDIVVLTNLNDEQPRLVFDAASQGCLIICPDSAPYRALGIPQQLTYQRGDAKSLAAAIVRAIGCIDDAKLREDIRVLAGTATIETMHELRRDWINATLLASKTVKAQAHPA